MGGWGARNHPTEFKYILKSDRGTYAVGFQKWKTRYYKGGFASLAEAIKNRDETLSRLQKKYLQKQEETYGRLLPSEQQCERCARPHLPGSKYCEFHAKRKARSKERAKGKIILHVHCI